LRDSAIIIIPSHPKYLSIVRAVTGKMAELSGMAESAIEDVKLAVDEACSNVIKHAYKAVANQKIILRFKTSSKGFEVIIDDNGIKVLPESLVGRDLEDIRPGGLGIHFIKKVFDVFAFDEKKKKGNRLRLLRYMKGKNGD
jgi:serine/threonine-protein kinase RsbW